jgi:probable DNA repair protein
MYLDRISSARAETRRIARDSLAEQQWEAVLSEAELIRGASAWPSQPLSSVTRWLANCFEAAQASGQVDRNRLLLSSNQTDRLWRRVIEESSEGQSLVSSSGVSRWARSARQSLLDCGLAPNRQRGREWRDDAAAFLRWNDSFERLLERNGWVDPDSMLYEINRLPAASIGHDLLLLDLPPLTAAFSRLQECWRGAGFAIGVVEPDDCQATVDALISRDSRDELDLAVAWAARRLESAAEAPAAAAAKVGAQVEGNTHADADAHARIRLAIVIPDLDVRRDEVERAFVDRLGPARVFSAGRKPIEDIGLFGAALSAIELLSGSADFSVLSRWLRSPFFVSQDPDGVRQRATLEIALRSVPGTERNFAESWRRHGLRQLFARKLPDTARQLDLALDRLPRRATPTGWTGIWQSCLESLGWQGFELELPEAMLNAWNSAWAAFSELTPIVGAIDRSRALDAFGGIVAKQSIYEPMPLDGVHLMHRIGQVGPGFAGAWIAGFSDDRFPEPNSANPLLPWPVQTAHRMPGASPEETLAAARAELARLFRRVPEARFSCPARSLDQPLMPGPLIRGWLPAAERENCTRPSPANRIGARSWQQRSDKAPAMTDAVIPGGTRTLDLQAKSPAKAFCIARLKAEPLELPTRGIDPRLRGLLVHRTLELLLAPGQTSAIDSRFDLALTTAFQDYVKPGDAVWDAQVRAERTRIRQLLDEFGQIEAGRDPFTTIAVERRTEISIESSRLRCRIDRIDCLPDGGEILIDYKTGQSVGARWFDDRLSDCQLPIYAQAAGNVAGIATIRLGGTAIEYRGAGRQELRLPGPVRSFDGTDWQRQLAHWRIKLSELLDEFSRGDVRVAADANRFVGTHAMEHAGGAFAPLTRVGDIE